MIRFHMPKLRIYQQILICFGLIVTVPLLGVTFIINNINQYALKKELARFTEHTAEALYRDFGTEMDWQKQQSQMMSQLIARDLQAKQNFDVAVQRLLELDAELDAVGLYDANGRSVQLAYRGFQNLSPELRMPDELPHDPGNPAHPMPFQVIYFNSGNPQDSPYYLRAVIPLDTSSLSIKGAAYYVQQKSFAYLQNLVRSNNSLYDAFYIIDSNGLIIAGPDGGGQQAHISSQDYAQFVKIRPGVTHEYSSSAQSQDAQQDIKDKDTDEDPPLKKVIVKMPEINWGIIIESPYHMKQKYIKRAGTQTILLILGCLLVILLLVLPYILGISRNFRQLIKGVKAMGEGNYFRRIRLISNFFTPYEIVYLTLEFNRMARKTADSWQTIQEANRKLAKMDEFKSNLIDTVSHELRTPLTSIKGYTSRLLRYDTTLDVDTRVKSLKVVKQQADRLGRLVEDLLVIPDLDAASLRVYPDRVELAPLLENSAQFIQLRYTKEESDCKINVILPDRFDPDFSVLADPDRLEQILINVLDNAAKYALPDTPVDLFVSVESKHPELIAITVVNQCDPIPMEKLEALDSLFEKFKRLDDSLVRTTRGSGLGLFITRGLVEAMNGSIQLFYDSGQFKVRFTIPVYTQLETPVEPAVLSRP